MLTSSAEEALDDFLGIIFFYFSNAKEMANKRESARASVDEACIRKLDSAKQR